MGIFHIAEEQEWGGRIDRKVNQEEQTKLGGDMGGGTGLWGGGRGRFGRWQETHRSCSIIKG